MAKKRLQNAQQLSLWEQGVMGSSTVRRDVQAESMPDTIAAEVLPSLERVDASMIAATRKRSAQTRGHGAHDQKREELLAWGEAHAYWELNFCRPDGSLGQLGPGMHEWRAFVETANAEDLDLAWPSMVAWRADEANPDQILRVPERVPRRGVEDRSLFMRTGKALGYPLMRFRALVRYGGDEYEMVYHIQAGREVWLHRCLMATDEWLSWAIWAVMHSQNDGQVEA